VVAPITKPINTLAIELFISLLCLLFSIFED